MGLLDSVIGALGQAQGPAQEQGAGFGGGDAQAALLTALVAMLGPNAPGGGLAGLIAKLQQGGLADAVNSWVSTGQNQPVSPDQLESALPADLLGGLARQLGMGSHDLAGPLAQLLPQVVDKLTPQGHVPEPGAGAGDLSGLADLAGQLGDPDALLGQLGGLLRR